MAVALYPGSFDPIHNGHLAVIEAAAAVFDEIIIGVGHNPAKPSGLFSPEERAAMIKASVAEYPNVRVDSFTGLVTVAAAEMAAVRTASGASKGM